MGKAAILKSVKKSKPALMPLPEINSDSFSEDVNLLENFKSNVELVGGNLREINENEKLDTVIKELYPKAQRIVSQTSESNLGTVSITKDFEWDNPNLNLLWEMTAKYGIPYFSNFINCFNNKSRIS